MSSPSTAENVALTCARSPAGDGPPEDASRNLVEALPYLLGSGGTTIFDLIIMLQSYAYRDLAPQDAADKSGEEAPLVEG